MLLDQICAHALDVSPDKPAILAATRSLTYRELSDAADCLAADWAGRGFRPGDRVALWLPNRPEALVAYLACFRAGLIAVALDFQYQPGEAAYCLDRSGAVVLVTLSSKWTGLTASVSHPAVGDVVLVDADGWLDNLLSRPKTPPAGRPGDTDCLSTVFFTSGTTSRPKGVTHTSRRTVSRIDKFIEEAALGPDTVSLVTISLMRPLAFQLLAMAVFRVGGTVRLIERFTPEAFWDAYLEVPSPTLLALGPSLVDAALGHPRARDARGRPAALWLVGGDRTPPALHAAFRTAMDYELVELCGMTETGPYAMNPPFGEKRVGSAGVPPIGVALRLVDEQGDDVPPGAIGQVVVRTPDTMVGYWNDTLASFEVLRDGWMRTGDLARADEDGYLWLEGRLRDLIVRDGWNVAPAEVEAVLLADPEVVGAAAVGVPDPPHGEAVHAFAVAADGAAGGTTLADRLWLTLRSGLRAPAVPSRIHVVDRLPRNAAGKVDRAELRRLAEGTTGPTKGGASS